MRYESSIRALFIAALASSCVAVQAGRADSESSYEADSTAQLQASSASWSENGLLAQTNSQSIASAYQWGSESGNEYSQLATVEAGGPDLLYRNPGQIPEPIPHNKPWGLSLYASNSPQPYAWGLDSTTISPGVRGNGWGTDASLAWGAGSTSANGLKSATPRVPRMQVINTGVEPNTRVAVRSVKHSTTTTAAKHTVHTM
jgi:hypothetical protein